MNIFNFFKKRKQTEEKKDPLKEQYKNMSVDELFVHRFIEKKGKFLYCVSTKEVKENIENIFIEKAIVPLSPFNDFELEKLLNQRTEATFNQSIKEMDYFITPCEHLIAHDGSILFSSNQLSGYRINEFPDDWIVIAKTSQITYDKREAMEKLNQKIKLNPISNISAVHFYDKSIKNDDFLSHGFSNTKNLYLILLEDL